MNLISPSEAAARESTSTPIATVTSILRRDRLLAALLAFGALLLYLRTLAPSVATIFDDSLEFPLVAQRLAITHPTGYPLYSLLIAAAARLVPFGDVAYRVNLVSALAAAGAAGMLFLAARELGLGRLPALWATLVFATAETVWSQATIAEVYSLHLFLLAAITWATLRWGNQATPADGQVPLDDPPLLVAVLFGLGLAHHRMTLLWAPALAFYLWQRAPALRRPGPAWLRLGVAVALPLLLYLYLPLRSATGSLDGSYTNTLPGFLCWVTACQYSSFLAENPLQQTRGAAFYVDLLLRQFGLLNLALLPLGIARLGRRPEGLFLLLGGALNVAFALAYRVADPEVFWLPAVLVGALWAGAGLDAIVARFRSLGRPATGDRRPNGSSQYSVVGSQKRRRANGERRRSAGIVVFVFALLLAASLPTWAARAEAIDRSEAWAVHDLGVDILSQPLPERATLIGILGEMTLVRYFQETAGLRPDVETVAADTEAERLAAVEAALAAGRRPFLTRPLPGAPERWSLSALGPLIQVHPTPVTVPPEGLWPRDDEVGAGVRLAGWTVSPVPGHGLARQRLTLAWQPTAPIEASLAVSPRLLLPDGGEIQGNDAIPVRFAYPTTAWRVGEIVLDTYELPAIPGAGYRLILYRESDQQEVGRVDLPAVQP